MAANDEFEPGQKEANLEIDRVDAELEPGQESFEGAENPNSATKQFLARVEFNAAQTKLKAAQAVKFANKQTDIGEHEQQPEGYGETPKNPLAEGVARNPQRDADDGRQIEGHGQQISAVALVAAPVSPLTDKPRSNVVNNVGSKEPSHQVSLKQGRVMSHWWSFSLPALAASQKPQEPFVSASPANKPFINSVKASVSKEQAHRVSLNQGLAIPRAAVPIFKAVYEALVAGNSHFFQNHLLNLRTISTPEDIKDVLKDAKGSTREMAYTLTHAFMNSKEPDLSKRQAQLFHQVRVETLKKSGFFSCSVYNGQTFFRVSSLRQALENAPLPTVNDYQPNSRTAKIMAALKPIFDNAAAKIALQNDHKDNSEEQRSVLRR